MSQVIGGVTEISLSFMKAKLRFANLYALGECSHEYWHFRNCVLKIHSTHIPHINFMGLIIMILVLKLKIKLTIFLSLFLSG